MLTEANVTVLRGVLGIQRVAVTKGMVSNLETEHGHIVTASRWIDATYEGELAMAAGATMTWGREANSTYNEPGAGLQRPTKEYTVNPLWPDGSLIPHVVSAPSIPVGAADKRIEAYDFRLCITDSPSHRIPIRRPVGYNASEWEFWRRLYNNGTKAPSSLKDAGLGCLGPVPNNYSDCGTQRCVKCDMLGMRHATDMLNGAWDYPNATTAQ